MYPSQWKKQIFWYLRSKKWENSKVNLQNNSFAQCISYLQKNHYSKYLYLNLHKWYTSQIGQNKVSLALAVYRSIFLYWHWYLHVLSCASVFVFVFLFFILFLFFFVFVFEFPRLLTHLAFADSPPGVQHSPVLSSSPSSNLINSTWKKLKSWKKNIASNI